MKQNKLNFICVMTLTMTSGFLMAPAVEGKVAINTALTRNPNGKTAYFDTVRNPYFDMAPNQKKENGAYNHNDYLLDEPSQNKPTLPARVKVTTINAAELASKAKAATISAAEAAKQAAINAAKAVYNVPASIKHVYESYNKDANVGGQTGWNFSTLTNRPIAIHENQNSLIYNPLIMTATPTRTTTNSPAAPSAELQLQQNKAELLNNNNNTAKTLQLSSATTQQIKSSSVISNPVFISGTMTIAGTNSQADFNKTPTQPTKSQTEVQNSSQAIKSNNLNYLEHQLNKANTQLENPQDYTSEEITSINTMKNSFQKQIDAIHNPPAIPLAEQLQIAQPQTQRPQSPVTVTDFPLHQETSPIFNSAKAQKIEHAQSQTEIAQPTKKIQNKPTAPDYDAALGDNRPLRSLFTQPEITPQIKVPTIELSQDRSRTITSTTQSAAARNKARVDAKNQARFSEQPVPVETPVQKQQAQESLVIQPTLKIENKPQQSQETQQNQVAIIPGEGVRDIALQQNFRQLNLKSVQNGQAEIAQKNQGQANQQAISPIDKDFKHDYIYTKTAEATIPYPTKRYTGNEHLKNYAERSRAEILNKKEAQEAAIIHDVTPKYENIYPDNTKYTAKQTFEEQQKTPSQTPAATEFIGSQIRNKNPLEYHQKTITNQEIVSKKSQKSESTIEIETLTPEKVRKMSDYELYFLLDDAIARIDTDTLALEYLTPEQIFQPKIDKQVILQEIEIRKGQNKPTEPQETQSQKSEPATESFTDYETLTPEKVRKMSTEELELMLDFANATIKTDALIPLEHLTADQRIVPRIDKHVILQELQNRLHDQIKNVGSKNLKPIDLQSINKLQ